MKLLRRRRSPRSVPLRVAHLTTVDISLELLLGAQLDGVIAAGGEVIGISAPGPFVSAIEARGVQHVPLTASTRGFNLLADLRAAGQLWRILRRLRPTVLHTHNPKPGLYGRVVGRLAGVPIVVNTVHGLYATPDDRFIKRAVVYCAEAFASRWSDAELIQSGEDVALIRRLRLAPRRRVTHLGNGIDLTRFRSASAVAGRAAGPVVVGTVGRLVAEKGYVELFEAMRLVGDRVRLVVVGGDDPEKPDALDPAVVDAARADGVEFLGHRHDVEALYPSFDLFVLASHREGMPRALIEAAASGLPAVATDIRGCREVVDDGVTGMLVPSGSATELAAAISELVDDPGRRRQMGTAARQRAERLFDERQIVARVMTTYADVAARKAITLSPRLIRSVTTRPVRCGTSRLSPPNRRPS